MSVDEKVLENIDKRKKRWNNPTDEAVERLAEFFEQPQPRFDARDRAALAHVLAIVLERL